MTHSHDLRRYIDAVTSLIEASTSTRELIGEKTYMLNVTPSLDLRVWENPSQQQLESLLRKYHELRGVTHNSDYLVWNAHKSIHWDVRTSLGIPTDNFLHNFFVTMRGQSPIADHSYHDNPRYDSDKMTLWFNDYHLPPQLAQIFIKKVHGGAVNAH